VKLSMSLADVVLPRPDVIPGTQPTPAGLAGAIIAVPPLLVLLLLLTPLPLLLMTLPLLRLLLPPGALQTYTGRQGAGSS
jgi:hypothetical protein